MDSLKASMRWDEEAFGLEYDLDLFNIVAVDDFNMCALAQSSPRVCALVVPLLCWSCRLWRCSGQSATSLLLAHDLDGLCCIHIIF